MTGNSEGALRILAGVGLVALAVSLAGCERRPAANVQETAKGPSPSAMRVDTVRVARADLQRVSEAFPAELMPYETTDLYAKVAGFVKEMRVDYGDRVHKGDVLALLWVPELEVELKQKEALVRQAEAEVKLARDTIAAAEADYKRMKSQYERLARVGRSGVLDKEAVEETQYGFEASAAKRDVARADVAVKEARLGVAQENRDLVKTLLHYTQIEAPYEAVVTRRHLHTGAFLDPKVGQQPLLTVVRTDVVRVVVDVPEKEVRYLGKDTTVVVDLDALPERKFAWKITRMAPVLGSGKKVRVEVDIPNSDGLLYPGMYGHASVILEDKPAALTVPADCLHRDAKGTFLWLVGDGKAVQQRITVGFQDGRRVQITSGLSGTEEVICGGTQLLREGQAVLAKRRDAAAKP
jgi:HlyD family secretion protein